MKTMISRRTLLAGAFATPAILTFPRGAQAATNLTLGHNAAPGNPRSIATERFAELVRERSNGNISVRVAGSEQLGNEQSLLTSLRTGAVSMTVNSQGSTSALIPELAALGLPFLFTDSAAAFMVLEGPIGEELAQRFAKVQMVPLGWWDNGIRHITNSKRPIVKPDDLKGIKLRVPPGKWRVKMFQAYGANPSPLAFSEVFVALQTGVMDGQENPFAQIYPARFQEVQKYLSITGPVYTPAFVTAGASWDRLAPEIQKVLADTAKEVQPVVYKIAADLEDDLLKKLRAAGMQVNEADKDAFIKASDAIYKEFSAEVPEGKALIDKARARGKTS